MKTKKILIPILALTISICAYAQKPDKNKIKALKIAHITQELDLTEKEAQAFWPVYNANEDEREKLRSGSYKNFMKKKKPEEITEAEAKMLLDNTIKMEEAHLKLQKDYYAKLQKIFSAKKIMTLMNAERSFRRKMIEQFKDRHRGKKGEQRKPREPRH